MNEWKEKKRIEVKLLVDNKVSPISTKDKYIHKYERRDIKRSIPLFPETIT